MDGGNTWVVQLGDIVDGRNRIGNWKADDELKILSFLENLDEKAKKFRGKIVFILGNHEIMNILVISVMLVLPQSKRWVAFKPAENYLK